MTERSCASTRLSIHETLLAAMREGETIGADELRDRIEPHQWPSTHVNCALNDLVSDGRLRIDPRFHVTKPMHVDDDVRRPKAKADRRRALSLANIKLPCGVCNEHGAIRGFWWGTIKTCPACHGKGYR